MKNPHWTNRVPGGVEIDELPGRRVLWGRGPEKSAPIELPDYSGFRIYYLFEESILDDGSGTYTGTAGDDIVHPTSIVRYLLQEIGGLSGSDITTGASTFGSFSLAKTELDTIGLGSWEVILRLTEKRRLSDIFASISQQAPIAFWRSQWDNKFKAQVYKQLPDTWDYFLDHTGAAYSWSYREDVMPGSASVGKTRAKDCINEVNLGFQMYAPNGTYRSQSFCGPSASDYGNATRDQNAAAPNDREARATVSKNQWKVKEVFNLSCDQIYRAEQASAMRNFLLDRNLIPRIRVRFDSPHRPAGLEPNMITKISDDWYDYRPPPKYPSGTTAKKWSDLLFFVAEPVRWRWTPQGMVYSIELEEYVPFYYDAGGGDS